MAGSYALVIGEMNRFELPRDGIMHISRKWENNRIESYHAALKKLITPLSLIALQSTAGQRMRDFKSLSSAKATLCGIEAIRTIKHGHVLGKQPRVVGEIRFNLEIFGLAA